MRNQPLHPRTAVINNKQKNLSKNARHDALSWLAQQFPKAFDNTNTIQPLKIGILDDILLHAAAAEKAGISKSKLREAVVLFTRRIDYLTCLKTREVRINLQGELTTQVSEEEAERAALKIKRRIEKSAKNARATAPKKLPTSKKMGRDTHTHHLLPAFSAQQAAPATQPITIKHKAARAFDPSAVARLKEKLGLAKKEDVNLTS
jgi:ProP effector